MEKQRKLKLIGNGQPHGVRLVDAETGEMINGVQEVRFNATYGGYTVDVRLCDVEVDLTLEGDTGRVVETSHRFGAYLNDRWKAKS